MRSWSHHHSTDTVDDPIFRAAMRGTDSVSFVFGLEVTWDLIQQRQQEEEERQAMEALEVLDEMGELEEDESEPVKQEEDETVGVNTDEGGEDGANEEAGENDSVRPGDGCDEESTSEALEVLDDDDTQRKSSDVEMAAATNDSDDEDEDDVYKKPAATKSKRVIDYDSDDEEDVEKTASAEAAPVEKRPDAQSKSEENVGLEDMEMAAVEETITPEAELPLEKPSALPHQSNAWECTSCTFENKPRARKCKMCNAKRA